jgi:hypothetical protein
VYGCALAPTANPPRTFPGAAGVRCTTVLILAHQGGWDEMAMVAVPLLLVTVLLVVANRRAGQELARQEAAEGPAEPDEDIETAR